MLTKLMRYARALSSCQVVKVRGDSMSPAIRAGEYVWVNGFSYIRRAPARGDIVLAQVAGVPNLLIKRVVGLPHEHVELRSNQLTVNGTVCYEYRASVVSEARVWQLGADEYVLLGDNWARSHDSRYFGVVKSAAIKGKIGLPRRTNRLLSY